MLRGKPLLLVVLGVLSWSNAWALPRSTWFIDQLNEVPAPTEKGQRRNQAGLGVVNYRDTFSFEAQGVLDLSAVEVRVLAAERVFLNATDVGREQSMGVSGQAITLGGEVARYFATGEHAFGRMGLGFFRYAPASVTYIRFGLDTGIIESTELPWALRVGGSVIFTMPQNGSYLCLKTEALRNIGSTSRAFRVGGFLTWINWLRNYASFPVGTYENMLVNFGPAAELETAFGRFRLEAELRLFIDKENTVSGATGTPSELGFPDFALSWALRL